MNPRRAIWALTFLALGLFAASQWLQRGLTSAVAQSTEAPAPDPSATPAVDPAASTPDTPASEVIGDEPEIGAPVQQQPEIPPELRQSADNNVSFPVDI